MVAVTTICTSEVSFVYVDISIDLNSTGLCVLESADANAHSNMFPSPK